MKHQLNTLFCHAVLFGVVLTAFPSVCLAEGDAESRTALWEQIEEMKVGKYGMLPIYGMDVEDGSYSVEVETGFSTLQIADAELTVKDDKMQAALTVSDTKYEKLFMGTAQEAKDSAASEQISCEENDGGTAVFTIPIKALDQAVACAVLEAQTKEWSDEVLLFEAASLPKDALLVQLPDYDAIESAIKAQADADRSEETTPESEEVREPVAPMTVELADGEYSIEVDCAGGSGKATISSPTIMKIEDGKAYARVEWSSSYYDYMIVGTEKYLPVNDDEGNSVFEIPIAVMDEAMPVIADTTAMGTPHEINYALTFYQASIGSKSQLPQEAAKRVVAIAIVIIVGGGILNHFVNKRN